MEYNLNNLVLIAPLFITGVLISKIILDVLLKQEWIKCSECGNFFSLFKTIKYKKKRYCVECCKNKFNVCDVCHKIVEEKLNKYKSKKLCNHCFKTKIIKCSCCNKFFGEWEMRKRTCLHYCLNCYEAKFKSFKILCFPHTKNRSKTFLENKYKRFCGVEIECKNKNKNKNCFITPELKHFKFSQIRDSSLGLLGVEFVSKPMNGDLLFKKIDNFCETLNKKKYYVDRACGLHIHLGIIHKLELLKNIYLFYNKFEKYFFNMVPQSRQNTSYCEKFKKIYKHNNNKILKVDSLKLFKQLIYETKNDKSIGRISKKRYHDKRYCWVNFHSVFYRNTLEIRNHAGTLSKEKIKNWLSLHLIILNYLSQVDSTTINNLQNDQETFLSLFNPKLQKYILKRWDKFERSNEEEGN